MVNVIVQIAKLLEMMESAPRVVNMKFTKNIFAVFIVLLSVFGNAALASDGCDQDENNRIVPTLAMCSTHVYNIGKGTNPSGSDKTFMRDVIALKTTVMMQQMYKQYDYLETMIKRLKTQLEKAVLTTSLQAKGAASDSGASSSSSGGYRQENRSVYLQAGVSDCNTLLSTAKVFECLHTNWQTIYNSSNNGSDLSAALKKQLAHDYGVMAKNSDPKIEDTKIDVNGKMVDCAKYESFSNKKNFQECLDSLAAGIRKGSEAAQRQAMKTQWQYQRQNNY